MTRRGDVTVHVLPLFLALAVMALGSWMLVSVDRHMPTVLPPAIPSADAVKRVRLEVSDIESFEHYYGRESDAWRDLNPFIPFAAREKERERLVKNRNTRNERDDPTVVQKPPTLDPPPKAQDPIPKPQPRRLPKLDPDQVATPEVVGYLTGPTGSTLKARFGEGGEVVELQPGDSHAGWTFVGVTRGTATFLDADGIEYQFVIGDPVSGVTNLGPGEGDAVAGGGTGETGDQGADVLRLLRQDPRGAALLERRPELEDRIRQNPDVAQRLLRRLQQNPGR